MELTAFIAMPRSAVTFLSDGVSGLPLGGELPNEVSESFRLPTGISLVLILVAFMQVRVKTEWDIDTRDSSDNKTGNGNDEIDSFHKRLFSSVRDQCMRRAIETLLNPSLLVVWSAIHPKIQRGTEIPIRLSSIL